MIPKKTGPTGVQLLTTPARCPASRLLPPGGECAQGLEDTPHEACWLASSIRAHALPTQSERWKFTPQPPAPSATSHSALAELVVQFRKVPGQEGLPSFRTKNSQRRCKFNCIGRMNIYIYSYEYIYIHIYIYLLMYRYMYTYNYTFLIYVCLMSGAFSPGQSWS